MRGSFELAEVKNIASITPQSKCKGWFGRIY